MHEPVDVLIVGGGPGGLFMAAQLAGRGVRTVVCEEHARVGQASRVESFREPSVDFCEQLVCVIPLAAIAPESRKAYADKSACIRK